MKKRTQLAIILSLLFVLIQSQSAYALSLSMAEDGLIHPKINIDMIKIGKADDDFAINQDDTLDHNLLFNIAKSYEFNCFSEIALRSEQKTIDTQYIAQNSIMGYDYNFAQVVFCSKILSLMRSGIPLDNQLSNWDYLQASPWHNLHAYDNAKSDLAYPEDAVNKDFAVRIEPYASVNPYTVDFEFEAIYPTAYQSANSIYTMSGSIVNAEAISTSRHILPVLLWVGLLGLAFKNS